MIDITLDEYQDFVETTWITDADPIKEELRIVAGLAEEMGEVFGKIKKYHRGDMNAMEFREIILDELGDVEYYLAKLYNLYDLRRIDSLKNNHEKLLDRKARNVIRGSGDKR